ncbi:MAG TPA: branched-chain amino acid ABC transporter permease [Trueperaceae bacterium]|nr:branched-chain amino acid ABC transporter permease [Trueperaceae bacterium]
MASTSIKVGKRKINWIPWLIVLVILAIVVGRIIYLGTVHQRFSSAYFIRAFLESLKLGSLYALIALGYTMVYGIIRLINFAHGEVFMVGAFFTYFLFSFSPYPLFVAALWSIFIAFGFMKIIEFWRGKLNDPVVLAFGVAAFILATYLLSQTTVNFFVALVFSMLLTGVLGILIDKIAYAPLRTAPRNSLLITAIAVSFFWQNFGLLVFTNRQTPFRPDTFLRDKLVFSVGNGTVRTTMLSIAIPLISLILVVILTLFVTRTRLGKAMRASAQDAEVAQMMGISVNKVIATTFLLGSMLAAAGGAMWGLNFGSLNQPALMGILPGIKAFAAAVIGGIGSLPGAVIGALIIGFMENFMTAIFPKTADFQGITEFKDTFAFILLIIVLLIRPSGIVGEDLSEKV